MERSTLLLADEHRLLVEGLRALLEPEFRIIGSVGDGRQLLDTALSSCPDAVLIDISMPLLNGIDAIRLLREAGCTSKLVVLTMHAEPEFVREALREVLLGRQYIATQLKEIMLAGSQGRLKTASSGPKLTGREREVLQLLAEGQGLKEIAAALGISTRTVEYHRYNLTEKLGLKTVAELARYAAKRGLVAS